jgi:hypothetical protein
MSPGPRSHSLPTGRWAPAAPAGSRWLGLSGVRVQRIWRMSSCCPHPASAVSAGACGRCASDRHSRSASGNPSPRRYRAAAHSPSDSVTFSTNMPQLARSARESDQSRAADDPQATRWRRRTHRRLVHAHWLSRGGSAPPTRGVSRNISGTKALATSWAWRRGSATPAKVPTVSAHRHDAMRVTSTDAGRRWSTWPDNRSQPSRGSDRVGSSLPAVPSGVCSSAASAF